MFPAMKFNLEISEEFFLICRWEILRTVGNNRLKNKFQLSFSKLCFYVCPPKIHKYDSNEVKTRGTKFVNFL